MPIQKTTNALYPQTFAKNHGRRRFKGYEIGIAEVAKIVGEDKVDAAICAMVNYL